jgi:hypothetical protein
VNEKQRRTFNNNAFATQYGLHYFKDESRRDIPYKTYLDPVVSDNVEFTVNMWEIIDSLGNLLIDKHNDYGPKNVSQSPGGPLNGLRVRMWDKIARINNLIDNDIDPKNESLRDSFMDLANYSIIALMVLDDVWPKE